MGNAFSKSKNSLSENTRLLTHPINSTEHAIVDIAIPSREEPRKAAITIPQFTRESNFFDLSVWEFSRVLDYVYDFSERMDKASYLFLLALYDRYVPKNYDVDENWKKNRLQYSNDLRQSLFQYVSVSAILQFFFDQLGVIEHNSNGSFDYLLRGKQAECYGGCLVIEVII